MASSEHEIISIPSDSDDEVQITKINRRTPNVPRPVPRQFARPIPRGFAIRRAVERLNDTPQAKPEPTATTRPTGTASNSMVHLHQTTSGPSLLPRNQPPAKPPRAEQSITSTMQIHTPRPAPPRAMIARSRPDLAQRSDPQQPPAVRPQVASRPAVRDEPSGPVTSTPTTTALKTAPAGHSPSFSNSWKPYAPRDAPDESVQERQPVQKSSAPVPTLTPSTRSAVCTPCTHSKRQCDGNKPICNICERLGGVCFYEMPAPPKKQVLILKVKRPTQPVPGTMQVPIQTPASTSPASTRHQLRNSNGRFIGQPIPAKEDLQQTPNPAPALSETQPNEPSKVSSIPHIDPENSVADNSSVGGDDQRPRDSSPASDISPDLQDALEVEPTLDAFTTIINDIKKDLCSWQEMNTQAELRQATINSRSCPQPELDHNLPDPFKAVTAQRRAAQPPAQNITQKRKLIVVRAPTASFTTAAVSLPRYKAIGRVSSNMLAPNYKIAKYSPYSAEDEDEDDPDSVRKYADFERSYNADVDRLNDQRECQERVWLSKPWIEDLLPRLRIQISDLLYFFAARGFNFAEIGEDALPDLGYCEQCGFDIWRYADEYVTKESFKSLPTPDVRTLTAIELLAGAFSQALDVSFWHIVVGGLLQHHYIGEQGHEAKEASLCLVCFRSHCPDHGSYNDPQDDADTNDWDGAFINDSEQGSNMRKFVTLPEVEFADLTKKHLCGVFCISPSSDLRRIVGKQVDGTISGDIRTPKQRIRSILADEELCSPSCFWNVDNRRNIRLSEVKFQPFLSASQKTLVEKLMPFYLNNKRGPCLISRVIKDVDCLMVFHHMVFAIFDTPHPDETPGSAGDNSAAKNQIRKKKGPPAAINVNKSSQLIARPPFVPCSHAGSCHNNPDCSCARSQVYCEHFCGCDDSCKRRFRGCTCKASGRNVCFRNSRCECWNHARECDPHLCGSCGVIEVLDSLNKYRDEVRSGRCRNNRIQLGMPAPTTKAPSQVQGYGLYGRADISSGEFIGEYIGEVVSRGEANRRGTVYHLLNQEYLFHLNAGQEIDASRNGNKTRFMNNSQRDENINVEPISRFCNGVVRIGLFAKRNIVAGEELLWKYGYADAVTKFFWEPGEKPATKRALIPFSTERLTRNIGRNTLAGENKGDSPEEDRKQSVSGVGKKRKRHSLESPEQERAEDSAEETFKILNVDDSEDSDYDEANDVESDDADVDEEELEEDSEAEMQGRRGGAVSNGTPRRGRLDNGITDSPQSAAGSTPRGRDSARPSSQVNDNGRKRKLNVGDRRIGGESQRQGWATRKMNESGPNGVR